MNSAFNREEGFLVSTWHNLPKQSKHSAAIRCLKYVPVRCRILLSEGVRRMWVRPGVSVVQIRWLNFTVGVCQTRIVLFYYMSTSVFFCREVIYLGSFERSSKIPWSYNPSMKKILTDLSNTSYPVRISWPSTKKNRFVKTPIRDSKKIIYLPTRNSPSAPLTTLALPKLWVLPPA